MVLGLFGCNTPCSESALVAPLANLLVSTWQCKDQEGNANTAGVTAWLSGIESSAGLCSQATSQNLKAGPIGTLICSAVFAELRNVLANQLPTNLGCNTALVGADAAMAFTALCSTLVPI